MNWECAIFTKKLLVSTSVVFLALLTTGCPHQGSTSPSELPSASPTPTEYCYGQPHFRGPRQSALPDQFYRCISLSDPRTAEIQNLANNHHLYFSSFETDGATPTLLAQLRSLFESAPPSTTPGSSQNLSPNSATASVMLVFEDNANLAAQSRECPFETSLVLREGIRCIAISKQGIAQLNPDQNQTFSNRLLLDLVNLLFTPNQIQAFFQTISHIRFTQNSLTHFLNNSNIPIEGLQNLDDISTRRAVEIRSVLPPSLASLLNDTFVLGSPSTRASNTEQAVPYEILYQNQNNVSRVAGIAVRLFSPTSIDPVSEFEVRPDAEVVLDRSIGALIGSKLQQDRLGVWQQFLLRLPNQNLNYLQQLEAFSQAFVSYIRHGEQYSHQNSALFNWLRDNVFENRVYQLSGPGSIYINIQTGQPVDRLAPRLTLPLQQSLLFQSTPQGEIRIQVVGVVEDLSGFGNVNLHFNGERDSFHTEIQASRWRRNRSGAYTASFRPEGQLRSIRYCLFLGAFSDRAQNTLRIFPSNGNSACFTAPESPGQQSNQDAGNQAEPAQENEIPSEIRLDQTSGSTAQLTRSPNGQLILSISLPRSLALRSQPTTLPNTIYVQMQSSNGQSMSVPIYSFQDGSPAILRQFINDRTLSFPVQIAQWPASGSVSINEISLSHETEQRGRSGNQRIRFNPALPLTVSPEVLRTIAIGVAPRPLVERITNSVQYVSARQPNNRSNSTANTDAPVPGSTVVRVTIPIELAQGTEIQNGSIDLRNPSGSRTFNSRHIVSQTPTSIEFEVVIPPNSESGTYTISRINLESERTGINLVTNRVINFPAISNTATETLRVQIQQTDRPSGELH